MIHGCPEVWYFQSDEILHPHDPLFNQRRPEPLQKIRPEVFGKPDIGHARPGREFFVQPLAKGSEFRLIQPTLDLVTKEFIARLVVYGIGVMRWLRRPMPCNVLTVQVLAEDPKLFG